MKKVPVIPLIIGLIFLLPFAVVIGTTMKLKKRGDHHQKKPLTGNVTL